MCSCRPCWAYTAKRLGGDWARVSRLVLDAFVLRAHVPCNHADAGLGAAEVAVVLYKVLRLVGLEGLDDRVAPADDMKDVAGEAHRTRPVAMSRPVSGEAAAGAPLFALLPHPYPSTKVGRQ